MSVVVAMLEVCMCGQDGEVVALESAPFQLRRRLELAGGVLSVGLRLRLGDAADAARRLVDARVDADLAEGACAEQRIQFTTQARAAKHPCREHGAPDEDLARAAR